MASSKPPRRPNRAHGAIDKLPEEVRLQIKDWFLQDITYQRISELLAEDGYSINRNQVFRWISRQRQELERIERAKEKAAVLAKYLNPDGNIESGAMGLASALCMEALVDAQPMQIESILDLARVARSVGMLQRTIVTREKWEMERDRKIKEAVAQMKSEVQRLLDGQPELTQQLLDVVYRAEERLMEKMG